MFTIYVISRVQEILNPHWFGSKLFYLLSLTTNTLLFILSLSIALMYIIYLHCNVIFLSKFVLTLQLSFYISTLYLYYNSIFTFKLYFYVIFLFSASINTYIKMDIRLVAIIKGFDRSWLSCTKNTTVFSRNICLARGLMKFHDLIVISINE